MNRGLAIGFILGVLVTLFLTGHLEAAPPPPSPAQVRPDIFPCAGCVSVDLDGDGDRDLQDINPTTRKAKATRSIAYRVVVLSGCNAGRMPADLEAMNIHTQESVGLNIVRNDAAYDFTVYVSCGLTQINKCGSVNVFCLPDGFPGNTDVYMSDVLSNYDAGSRLGIPLHEIAGHAVGTWNEQYATCGSSCGFAPTPNLRDFMNTGALARHGFEAIELGRWERTMWTLEPVPVEYPFYDAVRGCTDYGYWCYITGSHWIDPNGNSEWGAFEYVSATAYYQYNFRLQKYFRFGQLAEEHFGGLDWRCLSGCF